MPWSVIRRNVVDDTQRDARVDALEARVQHLEDHLALLRLVNSWGPAVDTGNGEAAASQFAEDAILESDLSYLIGPAAITAMVYGEGHQSLVRDGSAHIPAFPIVTIEGDHARATGYTRVYRHTADGYEVWRVSANDWEFRRTTDGWRITRRRNHVIDGGSEAKELLGRAVE
jgi:ketosteroid isomerase-like protein